MMKELIKKLRAGQVDKPFVVACINKTDDPKKKCHPADFPCDRVEACRKKFADRFDIIVYVKTKNGFYIIPFQDHVSWIVDSKTILHPQYNVGVKRLWFKKRHWLRSNGNKEWKNMDSFFKSPKDMKSWLEANYPEWSDFVADAEDESATPTGPVGGFSVESYLEALRKIQFYDNLKKLIAELYFRGPKTTMELARAIGKTHHGSVNVLLGTWLGDRLCKELNYDFRSHGLSYAVEVFAEYGDVQGNKSFALLPNFRKALETLQEREEISLKDWDAVVIAPETDSGSKDGDLKKTYGPDHPLMKKFIELDEILEQKKQVILYGPPGTGKTYLANEYVEYKTGSKNNEFVFRCTFHPEYGYEHFIEGFKPESRDGQMSFVKTDGVFKRLCKFAENALKQVSAETPPQFYLVIDEINRGDIPRIFGELITLIEADKRNEKYAVRLPHSDADFFVPENVSIIATMNTADRSIALLDTALRRRFGFIEIAPDSGVFGDRKVEDIPLADWFDGLNAVLVKILKEFRHDAAHLMIGHSYFMPGGKIVETRKQFEKIIRFEILPLLEEYCYERNDAFEKLRKHLENGLKTVASTAVDKPTASAANANEPSVVHDVE